MQEELKAIHYGQVELIPGVLCDSYVLDNDTTVMSKQGTADLLGMDLKVDSNLLENVDSLTVEVVAENSPHKGSKIVVYTTETIEKLISTYAAAYLNGMSKKKPKHKKKFAKSPSPQAVAGLMQAVLDAAIREACGLQKKSFQGIVRNRFPS